MNCKDKLVRIGYNKTNDSYDLLIKNGREDEWDLDCSAKCCRCEYDDKDAEPMFVSITLIDKLKQCIRLGYEVVY